MFTEKQDHSSISGLVAERYANGLRDVARQLIEAADALEVAGISYDWPNLIEERKAAADEAEACRSRLSDAMYQLMPGHLL